VMKKEDWPRTALSLNKNGRAQGGFMHTIHALLSISPYQLYTRDRACLSSGAFPRQSRIRQAIGFTAEYQLTYHAGTPRLPA
jgi:hypothetical protein